MSDLRNREAETAAKQMPRQADPFLREGRRSGWMIAAVVVGLVIVLIVVLWGLNERHALTTSNTPGSSSGEMPLPQGASAPPATAIPSGRGNSNVPPAGSQNTAPANPPNTAQ